MEYRQSVPVAAPHQEVQVVQADEALLEKMQSTVSSMMSGVRSMEVMRSSASVPLLYVSKYTPPPLRVPLSVTYARLPLHSGRTSNTIFLTNLAQQSTHGASESVLMEKHTLGWVGRDASCMRTS